MAYAFDRFLRYDELTSWLEEQRALHPDLMTIESYGRSHEGRDLLLVTITDPTTGTHDTKPAAWIDAQIHSVECTAGVSACWLIHRLLTGHGSDEKVTRALRGRTFYIVPRVNPDGIEWSLAESPLYRRSSTRVWPWRIPFDPPGLRVRDMDGDGCVRTMRIADPHGAWTPSARDPRIMAPVPLDGLPEGVPRYRLLAEGDIVDHDGFTVPTPRPKEGLDLNRNYPAGWDNEVPGAGDHPLSEPEIDASVRAILARPNVCSFNQYHTSGGVLLRPSSTKPDSALAAFDLWAWKALGDIATAATGYSVHSVYEDFTWDPSRLMSGAADDWAYEQVGIVSWTTEFWDVVKVATGTPQGGDFWTTGPTEEQNLAVLAWSEREGHDLFADWTPFDHPQLGPVEIGGFDDFRTWSNPPHNLLADEVRPHAEVAISHALAAPCLEIVHQQVTALGDDVHLLEVGLANTGFLPTYVTEYARGKSLVRPIVATVDSQSAFDVIGGQARQEVGQLAGQSAAHFNGGNDGTPDRCLVRWTLRCPAGTSVQVRAAHDRAGAKTVTVTL